MRKTSLIMSIVSIFCACIGIICAKSTIVAFAANDQLSITTIIKMAYAGEGQIFFTESCDSTWVDTDNFNICEVVQELTSSEETEDLMLTDFKAMFSNTENQEMKVYEDIITGKTTVYAIHPRGSVMYEFNYCHPEEDIQYVLSEFYYMGFKYTVYLNGTNAQSCIAKTWSPQPGRVYDCRPDAINSEVDLNAFKKLLNEAFTEGSQIDFIPEGNGNIHGFVTRQDGRKEEYIFERFNQKPFEEEHHELIAEASTEFDDYCIILEDGVIRIESGKRSGYLDETNSWAIMEYFAK